MISAALMTIASVEFDRSVDFYTRLLGTAPDRYIPSIYAEFSLPGVKLGIFYPRASDRDEFIHPQQSGMSLCLEVPNLEEAIDRLSQLGYPPTGQIVTESHGREIYAYDPDGNRLILHSGG